MCFFTVSLGLIENVEDSVVFYRIFLFILRNLIGCEDEGFPLRHAVNTIAFLKISMIASFNILMHLKDF